MKAKPIFKVGDHIEPIKHGLGYENAIVRSIDDKCYRLTLPKGIAIIPISSQMVYKLKTK